MADRPDPTDLPARFMGMPVVRRRVTMPTLEERTQMRSEATTARSKFIKWLVSDHRSALKRIGLSDRAIKKMADTGHVPVGYHVHHKMPVGVGGTNDFDNLVLLDAEQHAELHRFIDPPLYGIQVGETRVVPLCEPKGPVHVHKPNAPRRRVIDMEEWKLGWSKIRESRAAQAAKRVVPLRPEYPSNAGSKPGA